MTPEEDRDHVFATSLVGIEWARRKAVEDNMHADSVIVLGPLQLPPIRKLARELSATHKALMVSGPPNVGYMCWPIRRNRAKRLLAELAPRGDARLPDRHIPFPILVAGVRGHTIYTDLT